MLDTAIYWALKIISLGFYEYPIVADRIQKQKAAKDEAAALDMVAASEEAAAAGRKPK